MKNGNTLNESNKLTENKTQASNQNNMDSCIPLPWQIKPWQDKSGLLLLTGSAGGGKSFLAASKCIGFCRKYPGAMVLIARKTKQSLINSTMLFISECLLKGDPRVRYRQGGTRYEFANGSILAFGGMAGANQREATRSIGQSGGLDMLWMEEATQFSEADFNDISARLRGQAAPWRQIILSTNPDTPQHWIYKRMILGGEASVYFSCASDNKYNPEDYITKRLANMPGPLGLRLREGRWVGNEGSVYADFDPSKHIIDNSQAYRNTWRDLPLYRSIDFGYNNPFVCQWWFKGWDGELVLFKEIYKTKLRIDKAAELILKTEKDLNMPRPYATFADHDSGERAMLAKYGIHTSPARKDVMQGIQAVMKAMQLDERGIPRLFIFRDSLVHPPDSELLQAHLPTCTLDEIPGYSWVTTNNQIRNDEPVKENDHGCDAMRYLVFSLIKRASFSS